jgi:hypothetical protein
MRERGTGGSSEGIGHQEFQSELPALLLPQPNHQRSKIRIAARRPLSNRESAATPEEARQRNPQRSFPPGRPSA